MPDGILGDGGLQAGKYNMALVRRAIKNGWDVPPEIKKLVVNQMALVVGKSEDERNRVAASKVLVAADAVDARREATQAEEDKPEAASIVNVLNLTVLTHEQLEQLDRALAIAAGGSGGTAPPDRNGKVSA